MLINREIRRFLPHLGVLATKNRRKFSRCQSFMLYQLLLDYMRYWRRLEATKFQSLSEDAQDELYYYFTEFLLMEFDCALDLYFLIRDIDGKPLYINGREPDPFWSKKAAKPINSLPRLKFPIT